MGDYVAHFSFGETMRHNRNEFEKSEFAKDCDLSMKPDSKFYNSKLTRIQYFLWEKSESSNVPQHHTFSQFTKAF